MSLLALLGLHQVHTNHVLHVSLRMTTDYLLKTRIHFLRQNLGVVVTNLAQVSPSMSRE